LLHSAVNYIVARFCVILGRIFFQILTQFILVRRNLLKGMRYHNQMTHVFHTYYVTLFFAGRGGSNLPAALLQVLNLFLRLIL
jgi:hypothetical protein